MEFNDTFYETSMFFSPFKYDGLKCVCLRMAFALNHVDSLTSFGITLLKCVIMRSSFRKVHIDERETSFGKSDKSCQPMKPDWDLIWFLTAHKLTVSKAYLSSETLFNTHISSAQLSIKVVCIANVVFLCVLCCESRLHIAFGFVVHLVFHRDTHSTATKVLESWALLADFYRWSFLMPLLRENANLHIALLLFDWSSKYKVLIKNRFEINLQIFAAMTMLSQNHIGFMRFCSNICWRIITIAFSQYLVYLFSLDFFVFRFGDSLNYILQCCCAAIALACFSNWMTQSNLGTLNFNVWNHFQIISRHLSIVWTYSL